MEAQGAGAPRNRKLKARRDPRLSGSKRTVSLQLDQTAYERLMTHVLKRGGKPAEVVNLLILDGLPSWTIQERGAPAEGRAGSGEATRGEAAVEPLPVAQSLPAAEVPPRQGRGVEGPEEGGPRAAPPGALAKVRARLSA